MMNQKRSEHVDGETFDIIGMARDIQSGIRRKRVARVAAGAALAGFGVARGRWLGLALAGVGLHLVLEGVTGNSLKHYLRSAIAPKRIPDRSPSGKAANGHRDMVDEASWESFPASDPPGYPPGVV